MRASLASALLLVIGTFFGKNECGRTVSKLDQQHLSAKIDQLAQDDRQLPEVDVTVAIPNWPQ
jgi:hypothetical protein